MREKIREFWKGKAQPKNRRPAARLLAALLVCILIAGIAVVQMPSMETQAAAARLTGASGEETVLDSGLYYVEDSVTYQGGAAQSGLKIKEGAKVFIYLKENSTLTAIGGDASGQKGAGAGIHVPEGSTLVFLGAGQVNATGGNAANGGNGGDAENSQYEYRPNGSLYRIHSGAGGAGGDGGGGAGAGIGTPGGTGGNGGTSSKDSTIFWDYKTQNGTAGADGAPMGAVYVLDQVEYIAVGGAAGTTGGAAGKIGNTGEDREPDTTISVIFFRRAGASAGGAGGGYGLEASDIGTGGGGGGAGGAGARGSYYDYNVNTFSCELDLSVKSMYGAGAGGGYPLGQGSVVPKSTIYSGSYFYDIKYATSGTDATDRDEDPKKPGEAGNYSFFDTTDEADNSIDGVVIAHGRGSLAGNGGMAGSESVPGSIRTTQDENSTMSYKVTFVDQNGKQIGAAQSYTFLSDTNTVTMPGEESITVPEGKYFAGWSVQKADGGTPGEALEFGGLVNSSKNLTADDENVYQPGEQVEIGNLTTGDIVVKAKVSEYSGAKAETETLVIAPGTFETETTYVNYTVKVTVDGIPTDIGTLTLHPMEKEDTDTSSDVLLASGTKGEGEDSEDKTGIYTLRSAKTTGADMTTPIYQIRIDGTDTGVTVKADKTATVAYRSLQVEVHLDGQPVTDLGEISLAEAGAPKLTEENGVYRYLALNPGETSYAVLMDGDATGQTVSYGTPLILDYYTAQVTVKTFGGAAAESVVLQENTEDGSAGQMLYLTQDQNVWSLTGAKDETKSYTLYVNGTKTSYDDIQFTQRQELTVYVDTTTIETSLDGQKQDMELLAEGQPLDQKAVGTYQMDTVTAAKDLNADLDETATPARTKEVTVEGRTHTVNLGETNSIAYYTVTYENSGEAETTLPVDTDWYCEGDQVTAAEVAQSNVDDWSFAGWKLEESDSAQVIPAGESFTMPAHAVTLTAQWEEAVYTITYELDGGTNAAENPGTYKASDSEIALAAPTKEGYVFTGWTEQENEEAETNLVIPAGSKGDKTFTAHWEPETWSIHVTPTETDFGQKAEAYTVQPEAQRITITNDGNQNVTLDAQPIIGANPDAEEGVLDGTDAFIVTKIGDSKTGTADASVTRVQVQAGERAVFTVQPKAGLAKGTYEALVTVKTTDSGQEKTETIKVRFTVGADVTAPEGRITAAPADGTEEPWSEEWINSFLEDAKDTEPLLTGKDTKVTIQAGDNGESGLKSLKYHVSDRILTEEEVQALPEEAWTEASAPAGGATAGGIEAEASVTLKEGSYIIYAKTEDQAGNIRWLSSDDFEVDQTAPVFVGLEDGKTYVGATDFTVTELHPDKVYLDGQELTANEDGSYTIPAKETEQTLRAVDKVGNETVIRVTIQPREYQITFDANGGSGSVDDMTVKENQAAALPSATFTAPDYMQFKEWAIGAPDSDIRVAADESYTFDADTTVYAVWEYETYSITYDLTGVTEDPAVAGPANVADPENPDSYTYATPGISIQNPTHRGYTFKGWKIDDGTEIYPTYILPEESHGNKKLTAVWEKKDQVAYTIRYWLQNVGAGDEQNDTNYALAEQAEAYEADGAQVTAALRSYEGFTAPAAKTLTIQAELTGQTVDYYYTRNSYTLTLESGEGILDVSGTGTYQYGEAVSLGAIVQSGYVWKGWTSAEGDVSEDAYYRFRMPARDLTYRAKTETESYAITYDLNGDGASLSESAPESYTSRSENIVLPDPKRDGYDFVGWSGTDLAGTVTSVTIPTGSTGDRSYTAHWIQKDAEDAEKPTETSYTVNHWVLNVGGDENSQNEENYTIFASQTLGGEIGEAAAPALRNDPGLKALSNETSITLAEKAEENVVNYYYTRETYTIELTGGANVSGVTVLVTDADGNEKEAGATAAGIMYGQTVTLRASMEDGYEWQSWTETAESNVFASAEQPCTFTMPAHDLAWTANAKLAHYTINYNLDGGSGTDVNPTSYTSQDGTLTLVNPVRAGYTFAGWTGQGIAEDEPQKNVTTDTAVAAAQYGNLSYTACWKAKEDTPYTVRHWLQKKGKDAAQETSDSYKLQDTEYLTGTTDEKIQPALKEYEGYEAPELQEVTIAGDGSLTVNYYYRVLYDVTVKTDGHGSAKANLTKTGSGKTVILTATPSAGYRFKGWQVVKGEVTLTGGSFVMPESDVTVKALFEQIPDNSSTPQQPSGHKKGSHSSAPSTDPQTPDTGVPSGSTAAGKTGDTVTAEAEDTEIANADTGSRELTGNEPEKKTETLPEESVKTETKAAKTCFWHWLILLTVLLGAVLDLILRVLTGRKAPGVLVTAVAAVVSVICAVLGTCHLDWIFAIVGILILIILLAVLGRRKKDKEEEEEEV